MVNDENDWFVVATDSGDGASTPNLPGAAQMILARVRDMAPEFQANNIGSDDTVALVEYARLSIFVDVNDRARNMCVGLLRVDFGETGFEAAWVSPSHGMDEPSVAAADPHDATTWQPPSTDSAEDVTALLATEAAAWLMSQLRRPIDRYQWSADSAVIAQCWQLADTGLRLVGSGDPRLLRSPELADSVERIRP
jgi:hypothetical protein